MSRARQTSIRNLSLDQREFPAYALDSKFATTMGDGQRYSIHRDAKETNLRNAKTQHHMGQVAKELGGNSFRPLSMPGPTLLLLAFRHQGIEQEEEKNEIKPKCLRQTTGEIGEASLWI